MKKLFLLLIIFLLTVGLVSFGCGDDDDDTTSLSFACETTLESSGWIQCIASGPLSKAGCESAGYTVIDECEKTSGGVCMIEDSGTVYYTYSPQDASTTLTEQGCTYLSGTWIP